MWSEKVGKPILWTTEKTKHRHAALWAVLLAVGLNLSQMMTIII